MQGVSIVREDGARGTVVAEEPAGRLVVEFADGARVIVAADALIPQNDRSYRLPASAGHLAGGVATEELVIPVVAEELTVDIGRVARARVRVDKRVESREEVVDTPIVVEEVVVERIPINKVVEDLDAVPTMREEADTIVIPILEEVFVLQKQILVREEVRLVKRRKTSSVSQTVTLRREVLEIHRDDLTSPERSDREGEARAGKEQSP
jgi:uncharacterized protein (TIGR02271 family)